MSKTNRSTGNTSVNPSAYKFAGKTDITNVCDKITSLHTLSGRFEAVMGLVGTGTASAEVAGIAIGATGTTLTVASIITVGPPLASCLVNEVLDNAFGNCDPQIGIYLQKNPDKVGPSRAAQQALFTVDCKDGRIGDSVTDAAQTLAHASKNVAGSSAKIAGDISNTYAQSQTNSAAFGKLIQDLV